MNPTIKDVARQAGVSVATVSRILNNQPGYAPATKERVLEVVQEIGYTPNALARGLVKKSTRLIGILLPRLTSYFMSELLNGIMNAAHQMGYSTIIYPTGEYGKDTLEYLKALDERQVSGIIFTCEYVKDEYFDILSRTHIPVVLVSTSSERHQIPSVRIRDKQAAYRATRYLIEHGHRHIGLICGMQDDPIASIPRFEGYRQALQEADMAFLPQYVTYGDFRYQSGRVCLELLLHQAQDMTAVFAISDEMAVGALSYAYQQGIRVPDELSIMGYDDTLLAEMAIPPLTCVHQPIYEMGERAVTLLLDQRNGKESVMLPYSIVERESVRAIG